MQSYWSAKSMVLVVMVLLAGPRWGFGQSSDASKEIARSLGVLPSTIDTYRSRLMAKLKVNDIPALVRLAIRSRLIEL